MIRAMTQNAPELNVKIRFNENLTEEAEQALWSQLFDILGIYENESEAILSMNNSQ